MSSDPGDLSNLADLALPPAIPFWPPAAGVSILGGAAVAMLVVAGWRAWRRYRADAYLRRAATELDKLQVEQNESSEAAAVSAVLKRAAMVVYGREQVASLTGTAWSDFVVRTAKPGKQIDDLAAGLDRALVQDGAHNSDPSALVIQARAWLDSQRGRISERR